MKRKVWLNDWAWYYPEDPSKSMHISEDLFFKSIGLPQTPQNVQAFNQAVDKLCKDRKITSQHVHDEPNPSRN